MELTRALSPSCIKVPLAGTSKESVITELVDLLNENGLLSDRNATLEEIFDREQIRSTGVGYGIAIPHGRSASIHHLTLAAGTTPTPVDFDSVDGKPVSTVVLLLSPAKDTGPHIQALARISRMLLDPEFREAIEAATSAEAVYELFMAGEKPRELAVA